ncbi:MAG: hypothetical protein QM278_01365 [Pseudomonadota bacterium]|nr:hypothetical protein [Pseudomonadota bacterium]
MLPQGNHQKFFIAFIMSPSPCDPLAHDPGASRHESWTRELSNGKFEFKPLNLIIQEDPLRSDRNYPESPGKFAPKNNIAAPTLRGSKLSSFPLGEKEDGPSLVSTVDIVVANQTKTVAQETRGHAPPFVTEIFSKFPYGGVSIFFNYKNASSGCTGLKRFKK